MLVLCVLFDFDDCMFKHRCSLRLPQKFLILKRLSYNILCRFSHHSFGLVSSRASAPMTRCIAVTCLPLLFLWSVALSVILIRTQLHLPSTYLDTLLTRMRLANLRVIKFFGLPPFVIIHRWWLLLLRWCLLFTNKLLFLIRIHRTDNFIIFFTWNCELFIIVLAIYWLRLFVLRIVSVENARDFTKVVIIVLEMFLKAVAIGDV